MSAIFSPSKSLLVCIAWSVALALAAVVVLGLGGSLATAASEPHGSSLMPDVADWQVSGRVYQGDCGIEPPTSLRLQGVRVELYGSNNEGGLGTLIDHTTTDSQAWYGLTVPEDHKSWEYYNIHEVNPAGLNSVCATTDPNGEATVKNADQIQ